MTPAVLRKRLLHPCIMLAAAWLLSACASLAPPAHSDISAADAMNRYQRTLVQQLADSQDAHTLLAAALLSRTLSDPPPLDYHSLLAKAVAIQPSDPALRWAGLVDCRPARSNCPNHAALHTLQQLDPDNAAVWMLTLGQALQAGHREQARSALAHAASAPHYEDYSATGLHALARATRQHVPPAVLYGPGQTATSPAGVRSLLIYGLGSLHPIPGLQATAKMCREAGNDPATRDACLQLGRHLASASSPLARSLGLHLQLQQVSGTADRRALLEARRNLIWQVREFGKLVLDSRHDPQLAAQLEQLASQRHGRMQLIAHALEQAGLPLTAPPGWQPRNDDARP